MKDSCSSVSEFLEKYFDQEVTDEERSLVEGHLQDCPACRDALKSMEELRTLMKAPIEQAVQKEDFPWVWQKIERDEQTFASLNGQKISVAYLLKNSGRVTTEMSRGEAIVTGAAADLPFELTQGRMAGKIWIWSFGFEYRLTRFLESLMRYEGRKEGGFRPVHGGSVNVRAFF